MKTSIYIIAVLFFHSYLHYSHAEVPAEKLKEFQRQIDAFNLWNGNFMEESFFAKWITDLTSEERAALIPMVQMHRDSVDRRMPDLREDWNGLLGYLGDEEAMRMSIDNWRKYRTPPQVANAESGQLPLFLEPDRIRRRQPRH